MNLNFGMIIILPSPCYTHKEFRAMLTSGMGGANTHQSHLKIVVLCLTLAAHRSEQEACYSF